MNKTLFDRLCNHAEKLPAHKRYAHTAPLLAAVFAVISLLFTSGLVFAQDEAEAGNKVYMPLVTNSTTGATTKDDLPVNWDPSLTEPLVDSRLSDPLITETDATARTGAAGDFFFFRSMRASWRSTATRWRCSSAAETVIGEC